MKFALFFLVVLTAELGFLYADKQDDVAACKEKCPEKDKYEMVCVSESNPGMAYNRCYLNCYNQFYEEKKDKEVPCQPGSYPHCINTQCSLEDHTAKAKGLVCGAPDMTLCDKKCLHIINKDCKAD